LLILNQQQLQAVVAHEAAHDFVWGKWEAARAAKDRRSLHELELICDGVAIVTLHSIKGDPSAWIRGLEEIVRYNRKRFGEAASDDDRYPSMSDRRKFAESIIRRIRESEEPNRNTATRGSKAS
jgi:hypothetical protein